ncbi:alpha/beta fold hydrolase [Candidatus Kaiserbacteria bacterium]|nr:alpha/beta fold hydrolase [Candidatus Kaiserbacteria bacterium]
MANYEHKSIEKKWAKQWEKDALYKTSDKAKGKDNFFLLVEFPYPSGNLHVGHWYAFAVPDILARFRRMQGKNVLYPIGFDAFGLPAENAAIKNKLNPRTWTLSNIEYMKKQIRSMGTSFDWSREVVTCDPAYYKWTQWLFLQFFKAGLVYRKETAVNWCPKDKTVLANEQVVNGKCERCESEVVQRQMLQWNIKITDYADRLINDLDALDWPKEIKESQKNWIGRSEGAEIDFPLVLNEKKYTYVILHGFMAKPDEPRFLHWKSELEKQGHTVVVPELPNTENPTEDEQVQVALAAADYDEDTVLFGHSLGAVVAMKVAEKLKKPIARLILAGGMADPKFKDHSRNFEKRFKWRFDADTIRKNTKTIQILHDVNDYAISEAGLKRLEDLLGVKAVRLQGEEAHFVGKRELPVLRWLRPTITVFTTRADTLYGGTYLVLAPEHPLLRQGFEGQAWMNTLQNRDEVEKYVVLSGKKTDIERQTNEKEKTGVRLEGISAINPATGKEIPVYVADYVLGHYGTGAVMGVPAHDERDNQFAKKYNLPIVEVVEPLSIVTSGPDGVREGEPFLDRPSVFALVKHWSEDKYLCLEFKASGARGFPGGGLEAGEDTMQAALREIQEETGYTNASFVKQLGGVNHSKFYSTTRNKNQFSHYTPFLFQLKDGTREEVSKEEQAIQEVHWVDTEKVSDFINREDFKIAWRQVQGHDLYDGEGILVNSNGFDGQTSEEARKAITEKFGSIKTTYKLRDWIVSRQRYWGVPIPIVHCPSCGPVAVKDSELPVKLPEVKDYLPEGSGKSPLAKAKKWVQVKCPKCKGKAERETDTLDTFVDSSWYFLRYTDPKNKKKFADAKKLESWTPVDLYSGGAEHTTMHVLYSRFWHKALFDLGLVKEPEPYTRRMNRSLILGPDGQKMSKSRGNVIDPDEVVGRLGADTVRMYLAFIGPYNEVSSFPWSPDSVVGVRRFLERVWRAQEYVGKTDSAALENLLHKTIKKVGEDIGTMKFNTAISALMIFLNALEKEKTLGKKQWENFLRLLAPFAPYIAEELWAESGQKKSVHKTTWPEFDAAQLKEGTLKIAIQINGKTRAETEVPADADKETVERAAREAVAARLEGKKILRTIVVPGRLVNFVVEE